MIFKLDTMQAGKITGLGYLCYETTTLNYK